MDQLFEADKWRNKMQGFVDDELLKFESILPRFENTLPQDYIKKITDKIKDYGLWAVSVPKELGGHGLSTSAYCGVREALGRTVLWSTTDIRGPGEPLFLLYGCNEDQKERYLIPSISGEIRGCFALTEPEAGSDPSQMVTRATRTDSGWVINGQKTYISFGQESDFAAVFAVTDPEKGRDGITCFIVDAGSESFTVGKKIETMGGDQPSSLIFDNCYVSDSQVLGKIGNGFKQGQSWIVRNRIMLQPPICLGAVCRTVEELIDHFPTQVSDQWLGEVQAEYHKARLLMYDAALKFDRNEDARYEAGLCKVSSVKLAMNVLKHALEITGINGYSSGSVFERYYRDIRRLPITEGSVEMQNMLVSRALIKGYQDIDCLGIDID